MNTINRPNTIALAVAAASLSLFIGPIKAFLSFEPGTDAGEFKAILIGLAIFIFLIGLLLYFSWKGNHWCRAIFSLLVILGLIPYCQLVFEEIHSNTFLAILSISQAVLQLFAVVQFFLPSSNLWYSSLRKFKNA